MKKRILISMLLSVSLLFSIPKSNAYEWRTYTVGDGLKDNAVHTITADNQSGTIWFGTDNGASCLDGVHWKSYLEGQKNQAIFVEATDKIWFGTNEGMFLKRCERFTRFLPDLFIQDIAMDKQGIKWFATRTGIRSTVDGTTWENYHGIESSFIEYIKTLPQLVHQLSKYDIEVNELKPGRISVTSIAIDKKNIKWLATHIIFHCQKRQLVISGISFFDNVKWEFPEPTVKLDWSGNRITSIAFDNNDNLWYSRWGQGVFCWDGKDIHHYFSQDIDEDGTWFGTQFSLAIQDLDRDGRQKLVTTAWAGYDLQPRGIYVYDLMSGKEKWQYRIGPTLTPSNVAIGDVTGDGKLEVVAGSNCSGNGSEANGTDDSHGYIFILDHQGKNLWGNGQSEALTSYTGEIPHVAVVDLNKDGVLDIIGFMGANTFYIRDEKPDLGIIVTNGLGQAAVGDDCMSRRFIHHRPIWSGGIAHLDNDGSLEIIVVDDQGLLMILDNTLSLLHQQQFEHGTRLVAVADLYGENLPEILMLKEGKTIAECKLFVLDPKWIEGKLTTLWEYSGFSGIDEVILSDIEPGGATEILIKEKKTLSNRCTFDSITNHLQSRRFL